MVQVVFYRYVIDDKEFCQDTSSRQYGYTYRAKTEMPFIKGGEGIAAKSSFG